MPQNNRNRQRIKPLQQNKKDDGYRLKIVRRVRGTACVSIVGSGKNYNTRNDDNLPGQITKPFHDKKQKRGRILVKLGIWENGQNSKQLRKQE